MAPVRNAKLIFNQFPSGLPEPGKTAIYDTSSTIDLDAVDLNGSVLIKLLYISVDPRIFPSSFVIGQPCRGFGIGKILRSEKEGFEKGDYVVSSEMDYSEYSIPKEYLQLLEKVIIEPGLSPSVYVGAAGMPGKTAYYPWKEYSKAQKGETVFVSTAAGPVGSFVVQLAKLEGLKVIASVGSDEKVEFVKSLGADVVFNYKTTDVQEVLAKEGPINIYWDNVSGSTLDAALGNAAHHARFICCGFAALWTNAGGAAPMKNLANIVTRRITLTGFISTDLTDKWGKEFKDVVPKKLASGEIKYKEDRTVGMEHTMEALVQVLMGKNNGKKIIVVSED
ncbi:alcohol dehydrogenase [Dendrothele bispora CBS 962.96]|uniref:Alcohol dehydrogenase n=1 Tax=Dendrothele bispora (strain CBS 962.96) TaxID=1314807 RepID=A0A4S8LR43_DENBC|nr:alcohol dehydrogenase [Dendrothele bispora CBS 962.96]